MDICWDDSLAIGVPEIDAQHQSLVRRVATVVRCVEEGADEAEIGGALEFFAQYAIDHFAAEEALMARHNYPRIEPHRREHEDFMGDFVRFMRTFNDTGPTERLGQEIRDEVVGWLLKHIGKVDQAFGQFLAEQEASA